MVSTRSSSRSTVASKPASVVPAKRAAKVPAAKADAKTEAHEAEPVKATEVPAVKAAKAKAAKKALDEPIVEEPKSKVARTEASGKLMEQIERAVDALVAHEASKSKDTRNVLSLDDDEADVALPAAEEQAARTVWLNVGLVRMSDDKSLKPVRLPVPHPWRSAEAGEAAGLRVCLVVKDPQREYKDAVAPLRLTAVSKVSGVGKLRKKFPSFEQRRQLVAAHDMFLADKRVFAMLPAVLGKEVYARRKHPVPVDVGASVLASPESLKRELKAAIEATYLIPSAGTTSFSIRVGVVGQSAKHIAANVDAVVRQLATKLDGGLANVRSLHVKTPTSAALPIYARTSSS